MHWHRDSFDEFRIPTPGDLRNWRKQGRRILRDRIFDRAPRFEPADSPSPEMVPYSGAIPSSPTPSTTTAGPALRDGRYFLRIFDRGVGPSPGIGILRVKKNLGAVAVSGDLYANPEYPFGRSKLPGRDLVFPRKDYRCWIKVLKFEDELPNPNVVYMRILAYWMDSSGELFVHENSGPYDVILKRRAAPRGYPYPNEYFEGDLATLSGQVFARLGIGRFSSWLRSATLEIDTVDPAPAPDPGAAPSWEQIFAEVGWKIDVQTDAIGMPDPSGGAESFTLAELHSYMLSQARPPVDHDRRWYYHLLCVPRIAEKIRGYMYDFAEWDVNAVPREGAAIAAVDRYVNYFNGVDPYGWLHWGNAAGSQYGQIPLAYYRTAIHEIGHAMGLDHNPQGTNFFMTVTPYIAYQEGPNWFNAIDWEWSPEDKLRLAHWPDPWVRPGGTPWESYTSSPADADEQRGAVLRLHPVVERTPLGAPVRIGLELRNRSGAVMDVPRRISIGAGSVQASLRPPVGEAREIQFCCHQGCYHGCTELADGEVTHGALTLLGDARGPLFPIAGRYELEVRVVWESEEMRRYVSSRVPIFVVSPTDEETEYLAQRALGEPQLLAQLILGGDGFQRARDLLDELLANEQLGPHYRYLEARRLARRHLNRPADRARARSVADKAIMSDSEKRAVAGWDDEEEPAEHGGKA